MDPSGFFSGSSQMNLEIQTNHEDQFAADENANGLHLSPPEIVPGLDNPAQREFSSQELYTDSQVFNGDENAIFSQGTLEFLAGAIVNEGGDMPIALDLGADGSFNLAHMPRQDEELSQGSSSLNHEGYEAEFPCSQRALIPPIQEELPDILYDEDGNYAGGGSQQLGTEEFDYETGLFGTPIALSGQTSSQESSQGDRLPALTNYPGNYNFLVKPVQQGGKKWLFLSEENRIYCSKNSEILFSFELDFDKASSKNLSIGAMLVFVSNEFMNTPVPRCNPCYDEEVQSHGDLEEFAAELFRHVLRSSHPRAQHLKKEKSERWYVTVPLEKPQIGEHSISRNYKFTCLNSCKFGGINRRETAIMFFLLEGKQQVGRCCFNVKVCTGPSRDYNKDAKKYGHGQDDSSTQSGNNGKRKTCASGSYEESDPSAHSSVERITKNPRLAEGGPRTPFDVSSLPPRSVAGPSRLVNVVEEDDSEEICNSQESLNGEFVEHLHRNIKLAMKETKNPDAKRRKSAKLQINMLKTFVKAVDYSEYDEPSERNGSEVSAATGEEEDNDDPAGDNDEDMEDA